MESSQRVTIIIPTYNRARFICDAIQSVIAQTYPNWELIVIDDGSTDNTEEVVKEFKDERICYYAIEHCGIIGKVRNTGMRFTKGDFIAFLDSDDLWMPDKLQFQLALLNQYKQAAFTFSHGLQFGKGAVPPPPLENFFVGNVFYAHLLEERFILYPSTFVFKKDILNSLQWFDETFSAGESDFFLRIARHYEGIFSGEKLVKFRKHTQNISREREVVFSHDNIIMLKKFLDEKYITQKQYTMLASKQHYKQGLLYLRRSKPAESFKSFVKYSNLKPLHYKGWIRLIQAWVLSLNRSTYIALISY